MASTDIFEKAQRRHSELSKIIEAAEAVRTEWAELQGFLTMARRLFPNDIADSAPTAVQNGTGAPTTKGRPKPYFPANPNSPPIGQATIADRAEYILRKRGKLHLTELFKEMRATGWKATGDDSKDFKNLRNTIYSKKDSFNNIGKNT